MRVLIDGACPYCRALGRTLKALDLGAPSRWCPCKRPPAWTRRRFWRSFTSSEGDRTHRGYAALLALARRLPLLWPLYPLLLLLVPFGTGERLYRFLAKRRPRARASRGGDHP